MKTANFKKIVFFAVVAITSVLFFSNFAKADTTLSVDVYTSEDVYFDTNINTTGNVDMKIDGVNLNDKISNVVSQSNTDVITWQKLTYVFEEVAKYFYGTEYHPAADSIFTSLNSVFVNRVDEQLINEKLDNLNMRVLMLEKTMEKVNATAYCEGKMAVMKEYNLTWVKCGTNSTYYYNVDPKQFGGNDIIGIDVSETPVAEKPKVVSLSITKFDVSDITAGSNAKALMVVKNSGDAVGTVTVSLSISEEWDYEKSYEFMLYPGEEQTFAFTIFVPSNAEGVVKITGKASYNSGSDVIETSKEVIKIISVPLTLQATNYLNNVSSGIASNANYGVPVALTITALSLPIVGTALESERIKKMYMFFRQAKSESQ